MRFVQTLKRSALMLLALPLLTLTLAPIKAAAAVTNPTATAKVTFTFDDGLDSAYTQAAPTLAKYGLTGTNYVISGCVGMTTTPNTCHANTAAKYMSWAQVTALQNTYHWEIGSHTATHPYLASSDATDGQPNVLTPAQVQTELTKSKSDLAAHGINATDMASPYGDYNNATMAQIAKYYASHRGFADVNNNVWPYNDYLINDFQVQAGVTVAQVQAKIDDAIAHNYYLALTFHNIKVTPSTDPGDYEYSTANLDKIAAYVKTKQSAGLIKQVNVNQALVTSTTNMLANGSFNNGVADGWTTNNAAAFTKDTGTNGSYPDPTNAIKLTAGTTDSHLFSPKVSIDPAASYMLKNFVNVTNLTSGELAFYIDEYDVNGNWISGQYKTAERSVFVENMNFTYKATSASVKQASLQVILTANSGIKGYLDNTQWFPLTAVTPPVTPTNLVANGTFDSGIAGGWTTDDSVNITADAANHGSTANPVNSVSLKSNSTKNGHLFSPQVAVDSTKGYSLSSYLNVTALTSGEVGYYIDEYDVNGNWISGQYKTGIRAVGTNNVSFGYTPSSVNVKKASLQVITVANSGLQAYFDDLKWYQN